MSRDFQLQTASSTVCTSCSTWKDPATPSILSWCTFIYCTYIPSLYCTTRPFTHVYRTYLDLTKILILSSYVLLSVNLYAYHLWKDFSRFHSHSPPDSPPLICVRVAQFYFYSFYLFSYRRVSLLRTFWCIPRIITRLVTLL